MDKLCYLIAADAAKPARCRESSDVAGKPECIKSARYSEEVFWSR